MVRATWHNSLTKIERASLLEQPIKTNLQTVLLFSQQLILTFEFFPPLWDFQASIPKSKEKYASLGYFFVLSVES